MNFSELNKELLEIEKRIQRMNEATALLKAEREKELSKPIQQPISQPIIEIDTPSPPPPKTHEEILKMVKSGDSIDSILLRFQGE
ncbi:hypothetical protein [Nostoc sp. NMS4]|uniref:hypothetical protein n=1 Tax=Nostoc sp. NMS4 TaxID=2815390 RepID=UPI0025F63D60|nr:hypothetical protein [Nostoc sp. NMS4]MBN3924618.1 hypothetical protein [Nostoc sp. NMS4]